MSNFYKCLLLLVLIVTMAVAMPEAYNRDRRSPDPHKRYPIGYGGGHQIGHDGGRYNGGNYHPGRGQGGITNSQAQSQAQAQSGSSSGFGGSNTFASASASASSNSGRF